MSEERPQLDDRPEAGELGLEEGREDQQVPAAPEARIEELQRERDEFLDMLKRQRAEFDNYRKRVERERHELSARAAERLLKQLVPLLDDLERALDAAAEHGEGVLEEGVRLVHRSLAEILAREGLVEVPTDGAFDPHTQEALLSQPSEAPEGDVIQVLQRGYRLGSRVLRPARVVVSAGPPRHPAAGEEQA